MIIENLDAFKVWLSKTLDPICDADPSTLSRYVLALVKKEKPENELKDICIDQLDVFLQTKTKAFVDTLFTALKNKSYLVPIPPEVVISTAPAVTPVPVLTTNTAPSKPSENDKKKDRPEKQLSEEGSRDGKRRRSRSPSPRSRGRVMRDDRHRRYDRSRYSPDRRYGRRRSRTPSPRRRDRRSPDRGRGRSRDRSRSPRSRSRSRSWSRNHSRSRSRSRSRSKGRQPDSRGSTPTLDNGRYSTASAIPTIQSVASSIAHSDKQGETPPVPPGSRPRCKDYDEKGFCMRGDLCPYDHGLDPVVVEDISIPNMSIPPPNFGGPPPTSGTGPRPPPGPGGRGGPPPGPPPQPRIPSGPGTPQFPPPGPGGPPPPPGTMAPRHIPPHPPRTGPDFAGEGYNPEAPALTSVPPPGYWSHRGPRPTAPFFNPQTGRTRDLVQVPTLPESPPRDMLDDKTQSMSNSPPAPIVSSRVVVPQKRPHSMIEDVRPFMGRGRGRGRGYNSPGKKPFDYGRLGGFRRQINNENATLEVRKVPQESNNISKLNEHFGKFGTLVNVQICYQGDPEGALVTFSSNAEAHAAYKSSEPVFNNRFIKVFWHRKEEEKPPQVETDPEVLKAQYKEKHEQQQQENLKQKVLVTFSTTQENLPTPEQLRIPARARLGVPPANKMKLNNSATKTPESPIEKGIVYTSSVGNLKKTVFNADALRQNKPSLTSPTAVKTADFVAKIEAIKKGEELKKEAAKKRQEIQLQKQELLKKQIEQQKKLIEKLEKNKSMSAEDKSLIMTTLKTLSGSIDKLKIELLPKTGGTGSHKSPEQTRKEILDTELELMTKTGNGEDTTLLKKKLLELTKEASALGLLGSRGRGRGRGRGSATRGHVGRGRGSWMSRGRGRGTTGSLSLDKRPRTLQIKGFDLEEKDEIKLFFSQTCGIEKLEYNESIPSAIITFSTRKDAEKAIGRGSKFKKPLTIQWHTPLLRTISVVSDDSLSGALDDDEEESQVEDDLDEAGLLGADDEEEDDEESRSWRR